MNLRRMVFVLLVSASSAVAALTPPFEVVRDGLRPSTVVLLDRDGGILAEEFRPYQNLRLEWTPLRALPQPMLRTLLMAEDQRFFEHSGVDWRAFVAALWQNLWSGRLRGASTLSMQMAGMLDPALRPSVEHGGRRTISQKWDQTQAAAELETHWSKEQILEAYLNLAVFRGRLQGIAAASWGLFRKAPQQLETAEAAVLAALLRAPDASPRLVAQRACRLLRRMAADIDCGRLRRLSGELGRSGPPPRHSAAAALLARVRGGGGQQVPSHLDADLQQRLARRLAQIPAALRAAVVIADEEAAVRAYATPAKRPDPLSEGLPPELPARLLAVARAIDGGSVDAASLLAAPPPGDRSTAQWRSLRTWLAEGDFVRVPFGPLLDEHQGRSQAVLADLPGGRDPGDSLDLLGLLVALAGDGSWRMPRWRSDVAADEPLRLLSPAAAFVWQRMWSVVDGNDCVRWMPLAVGGQGALVAASLGRHRLVARAEGGGAETALRSLVADLAREGLGDCVLPSVPAGVIAREVVFAPAVEAVRSEWILVGQEGSAGRIPPRLARIVAPVARSIVDGRRAEAEPDFRIEFLAWPELPGLRWRLDGREIGRGGRLRWSPRAGLYRLELLAPGGSVVDRIEFAARGPL